MGMGRRSSRRIKHNLILMILQFTKVEVPRRTGTFKRNRGHMDWLAKEHLSKENILMRWRSNLLLKVKFIRLLKNLYQPFHPTAAANQIAHKVEKIGSSQKI